jgi:hypothetical protein
MKKEKLEKSGKLITHQLKNNRLRKRRILKAIITSFKFKGEKRRRRGSIS